MKEASSKYFETILELFQIQVSFKNKQFNYYSMDDSDGVLSEENISDELEELIEKKVEERIEEKQSSKNDSERNELSDREDKSEGMTRRSFLKKTGLGALAIGALGITPASSMILRDPDGVDVQQGPLDMNGNDIINVGNLGGGGSGGLAVSDSGSEILADVSGINFDSNVSVSDDGDGTVTVNSLGGIGETVDASFNIESGNVNISNGEGEETVTVSDYDFIFPSISNRSWDHDVDNGEFETSREAVVSNIDQEANSFTVKATRYTNEPDEYDGDEDSINISWHVLGINTDSGGSGGSSTNQKLLIQQVANYDY